MNWHKQGMWARDNGVGINDNLYGVQEIFLTCFYNFCDVYGPVSPDQAKTVKVNSDHS